MTLRSFFISLFSIAFLTVSSASAAAQDQDKIRQILLDAKFAEMDVQVYSKSGDQTRDVDSVQYKIGFKDGYQKAVEDLKKSLAGASVPAATTMAAAKDPEQETAEASKLVSASFEQLVRDKDWDGAIKSATAAITLSPNDPIAYINRSWAYA